MLICSIYVDKWWIIFCIFIGLYVFIVTVFFFCKSLSCKLDDVYLDTVVYICTRKKTKYLNFKICKKEMACAGTENVGFTCTGNINEVYEKQLNKSKRYIMSS